MRKVLSALLVLTMTMGIFVGCSGKQEGDNQLKNCPCSSR